MEGHHVVAHQLVQQHLEIGLLVEAALDQQHPILRQQGEHLLHPVFQKHQPGAAGEAVVVPEAVGPGVVGHVPVGHAHLAGVPAAEGGEDQQVVPLDQQAVLRPDLRDRLLPRRRAPPGMDQHLGGEELVDLLGGQGLVVEHLAPPLVLPGLAALQHAVLEGEGQHRIPGGGEQVPGPVCQADPVLKAGVGVRQELPAGDGPAEPGLVKDQDPRRLCEEPGPGVRMAQEQAEEDGIHFFGRLADGVPQEDAVLRKKAGILPKKGLERVENSGHGWDLRSVGRRWDHLESTGRGTWPWATSRAGICVHRLRIWFWIRAPTVSANWSRVRMRAKFRP